MDFSSTEDKLMTKLVGLKSAFANAPSKTQQVKLNRDMGVITGVSIWLMSNSSAIQTLEDFRDKLDSFTRVVAHPSYIEMEGNLCISDAISRHLSGTIEDDDFHTVMDTIGYSRDLDSEALDDISRERYFLARKAFFDLSQDEEVIQDARNCQFAMNFKFSDDYHDASSLYATVSAFCIVADKLEEVYQEKSLEKVSDGVKK